MIMIIAPHFHKLQETCNKYKSKTIHVYSVAGHGNGEADHVCGSTKVTIRKEIGAASFFANSENMVEFLNKRFGQKINPVYYNKEIDKKQLEIAQADTLLHYYGPILGSDSVQIMVFTPNVPKIRAAKYLCMCQFV